MMLLLTAISWSMAFLVSWFLRSTILKGPSTPFLLELPPYRLPTMRGILIHTWERAWLYIRKAGTILLAVSIIFWALMNFPELPESEKAAFHADREAIVTQHPEDLRTAALAGELPKEDIPEEMAETREKLLAVDQAQAQAALKNSVAGRMGTALESVTRFCGFDWRTNVALVGGFAAKEIVISVLGTAYSMGEVDPEEDAPLRDLLAKDPAWNPLVAFTLILFTMLYVPCVVSVVCLVKEAGSWKWGLFSAVFNTTVAFVVALLVYQGGRLLGIGI
jgi:ferrous iron transport protein B